MLSSFLNLFFFAKNQGVSSPTVEIFLPKISSVSVVEEDKLWCPEVVCEQNKEVQNFFVVCGYGSTSTALSKWLVECIKMAGPEAFLLRQS